MTCLDAEVDLRVGGRYRIVNAMPDGTSLTIHGEFLAVLAPKELVYTWRVEGEAGEPSRVTVRFEPRGEDTEVIVIHEEIPTEPMRDSHEKGWAGCLDGLERHFAAG